MIEKLLFRVAKSFSLPGLGMLLLPETTPEALASLALHTHLPLSLRHPDGHGVSVVASVEEIARAGFPETRALLVAEPATQPVVAGTEVWWSGAAATEPL